VIRPVFANDSYKMPRNAVVEWILPFRDMNREGGFSMNTLIEVGWFISFVVALSYAIKHLGNRSLRGTRFHAQFIAAA
jgi:hypothetical protein